jgi:hypothetical protein
MKICCACLTVKPFADFYAADSKSGYTSKCKECSAIYHLKRKAAMANGTFKQKKEVTSRTCRKCGQELSLDKFYTNYKGYYSANCVLCTSAVNKSKAHTNERLVDWNKGAKLKEMNELRALIQDLLSNKIKYDPIEREEFCRKHKVLHHREWEIDFKRLAEIDENVRDEADKLAVKVHRTRLKNIGIDVDELSDDELYNDNFLL